MVVFQWITGYIVVYPRTTRYIVVFFQDNKSYHGNWLYSSMSPKTGYIVTFPPDNWLNGSMSMDNRLYCCLSPGQLAIMTYLVSSRRSKEIWGGGGVKSMEGEAEPNLPFILQTRHRPSETNQRSVLFRLGP